MSFELLFGFNVVLDAGRSSKIIPYLVKSYKIITCKIVVEVGESDRTWIQRQKFVFHIAPADSNIFTYKFVKSTCLDSDAFRTRAAGSRKIGGTLVERQ